MIDPREFTGYLVSKGSNFFTGVPDSTFKGLTSVLNSETEDLVHLCASNECEAMGIASGYHLATGDVPVVYMQNSGFGKTVNPYTSLAAQDVYSIPVLMIIGWRGEPGKKDESQHKMMGRIMMDLLKVLEIDCLEIDPLKWKGQVDSAWSYCNKNSRPFALIVKSDIFAEPPKKEKKKEDTFPLRESVLEKIVGSAPVKALFISTTGKTSRELYEIRDKLKMGHDSDFYTVGSMGCASSIALGVSCGNHSRPVFIIDGDGAALMQMGTFAALGKYGGKKNITHILIDNRAHESTGGQPTLSSGVNFSGIAENCGYEKVSYAENISDVEKCMSEFNNIPGLKLLLVRSSKGSRSDLGRPKTSPLENKMNFMKYIKNG